MKKILILPIVIIVTACFPLAVFAQNSEIMPIYEIIDSEKSSFDIDSNGVSTTVVSYNGNGNIIRGVTITVRMQKKIMLLFWQDIDLGGTDGEWSVATTAPTYSKSITKQLSSGTYRVQIEYKIRGADGTVETINREYEETY